ncbi:hypothetical protein [Hymenobacter sp. YC55]|uniref:hypothetical protein n=1 Tax=Hymenobacter sp. YC55 TaxID=3034019 RepID=UPI0023F9A0B0|nr:hypothetical protein [Hymenobacter sp. YC55]MDF7813077.1 hypothetical protein [Hymenobacter sp. YC55]
MQYTVLAPYHAHLRVFVLFFVVALLLSNPLRAQQGFTTIKLSPEDENRGLNGVQKNFYFTTKDSPSDDDYQNAGYFGQRLRPYLAGNNEALENLNLYRRQKWLFLAERAVFMGSVATYGAQVLRGDGEQRYFDNRQKVVIGVAAVSLLSNIFITRHTNEHFERAVNAHNAGQPAAHRTGSLLQRLAPNGIGVAAAPTGQPQLALRWQIR